VIFAAVVVLSRVFQRWLEQRFLPTTAIDPGLKNSIHTAAGYIGFILAAILALSYAGINLANVALVAGALSVGIGFGLQSIVNNFVSGLILLAERPIAPATGSRSVPTRVR
jgi:potassium efflux system protein